jgi:pimeloyl-ACP methyl ester carboxylesterase
MAIDTETLAPADRMPPEVPDADIRHSYVNAGGLRVHVAEAGPKKGEPLLMLHGWPQHWYLWRYQIPELGEHYRLIMPDLRGLGWTDAPGNGYEKEKMADDIVRLLDAMELKRVRLMAHDWGGWLGFIICLKHPQRIERFLALNIPHPFGKPGVRQSISFWRFWYMVVLATPLVGTALMRRKWFVKALLKRSVKRNEAEHERDREIFAEAIAEPARAKASAQIYRTFLLHDLPQVATGYWREQRYRKPDTPADLAPTGKPLKTETLLLHGVQDFAITVRMLMGFTPYAEDMRVELVDQAGHFVAEDRPDVVNQRAIEFFGAPGKGAETGRFARKGKESQPEEADRLKGDKAA